MDNTCSNTQEEIPKVTDKPIIKWGNTTPRVKIDWLWKPFIPYGKVSIVQGDGGDGKTTMILDIAARLSRGIQPPALINGELIQSDELVTPVTTFYLTNEDEVADSSLVRFDRAGGDASKFAYSGELHHHMTLTEDELNSAIEQTGAKLIIVDPFQAFLPKGASLGSIGKMRTVSTALSNVAKETGAAIVLVGHLNKNEYSKDIHRGLGSVDVSNAARSIVTVFSDKKNPGKRYMRATKSNFDEGDVKSIIQIKMDDQKRISYEIADLQQLEDEKQKSNPLFVSNEERAKEVLKLLLANGPVAVQRINEVMAQRGLTTKTAQRAKTDIGAQVIREGSNYYWALHDESPDATEPDSEFGSQIWGI